MPLLHKDVHKYLICSRHDTRGLVPPIVALNGCMVSVITRFGVETALSRWVASFHAASSNPRDAEG